MKRVREEVARRRTELLDRWDRQLRAAAAAGLALDPETADLLPRLLDAIDGILERRFRRIPPRTPAEEAEGMRAALQYSLLGDFLTDAVLDAVPDLTAGEQRELGAAVAHAAVQVLVGDAMERESQRRRREATRLARLAHELRNSVTAARLSLDLLKRRRAVKDGRSARLLESSIEKLRNALEDQLLDEALSTGGLRMAKVHLGPVLAHAQVAASELGADDKKVTVLVQQPRKELSVQADPRVVRPALRGLLRAALEVARPGAIIRVGAEAARDKARVAVVVNGCRKLRDKRLPDLPALTFARRAARAHGGSLSARVGPADGCEFRLALPRVQRD